MTARSRRSFSGIPPTTASFFLDYYLSESEEGFAPPAPFTLSESDPSGVMPERTYDKDELRTYLEHGRKKCRARIESLTDDD